MSVAEESNLSKQADPGEGAIKKAKEGKQVLLFVPSLCMLVCLCAVSYTHLTLPTKRIV